MIRLVRYILSLLLLYGVYTETGKWTTLFGLLALLAIELINEEALRIRRLFE